VVGFTLNLGEYNPVLDGWKVLVSSEPIESFDDFVAVVEVDEKLVEKLGEKKLKLLCIYAVAREFMEYKVVAAMHVYSVRNRILLRPEELREGLKHIRVKGSRVRSWDKSDEAWRAVFWRGICYGNMLLSLDALTVVRVEPPKDVRLRERLRYRMEGARISRGGRMHRTGGVLRKLEGRRLAPWIYVVKKRDVGHIAKLVKEHGSRFEVVSSS